MSVYKYGSKVSFEIAKFLNLLNVCMLIKIKALSYDNKNLNVPSLKWIGLKLSDLDLFSLEKKEEYLLTLNERDFKIGKSLKNKFSILHEYELLNEVN